MRNSQNVIPVIVVPEPPRGGRDAEVFARGVRAYADSVQPDGVVVLTHHERGSDSPSVIVDVGDNAAPAAFPLAERVGELLTRAGLATEFRSARPREIDDWKAMLAAHATAPYPVIRASVPTRFGRDLTVLATAALLPLERQGILLVGLSEAVGEGVKRARRARERRLELRVRRTAEGVPI